MKELHIIFDSIQDIEQFVHIATRYPGEVRITEDQRILDGKAIMGLLSLGTNRKLKLSYTGSESEFDHLAKEITPYLA